MRLTPLLFVILLLGTSAASLLFNGCKKKNDEPKVELIDSARNDSASFSKFNITVKNTGDLDAYEVKCWARALRNDTLVATDTEFVCTTHMAPGAIIHTQMWFTKLSTKKPNQYNKVHLELSWFGQSSGSYTKDY